MMGLSRRKLVVGLGAAVVFTMAALGLLFRQEIRYWFRFVSVFERVGTNLQGFPEYRHRQTGMVLVRIPGGSFWMGSTDGESGAWSNERPRHRVSLAPFLIGKYEVSQAEWEMVMGTAPAEFGGDHRPVERVSWHDCMEFGKRTGLSLPTEAQWERACRGGTTTPFAFGESLSSRQANFNSRYPRGDSPAGEFREETVAIDFFQPNSFGLHNVHGNVREWCLDVYGEDFYASPEATARNPLSTTGSGSRVVRGGGWFDRARHCRSASRSWQDPASRSSTLGFRAVWSLP